MIPSAAPSHGAGNPGLPGNPNRDVDDGPPFACPRCPHAFLTARDLKQFAGMHYADPSCPPATASAEPSRDRKPDMPTPPPASWPLL